MPPTEPEPRNKDGGHTHDRVITRPAPRKKGLLDRLEGWLTR